MLCGLAASGALAACNGPTAEDIEASLKAATIVAIPSADFERIEIVNPDLLKAKWTWQAKVEGRIYACDADDQMRLPSCQASS
jgi:hypothetical protein